MVASVVGRSWPPTAWDGPSPKASLRISFWMVFHECFVELMNTVNTNVEMCRQGLANPEHKNVNMKAKNSKVKRRGRVTRNTGNLATAQLPRASYPYYSIYSGRSNILL
jgi:hypothetical protein